MIYRNSCKVREALVRWDRSVESDRSHMIACSVFETELRKATLPIPSSSNCPFNPSAQTPMHHHTPAFVAPLSLFFSSQKQALLQKKKTAQACHQVRITCCAFMCQQLSPQILPILPIGRKGVRKLRRPNRVEGKKKHPSSGEAKTMI